MHSQEKRLLAAYHGLIDLGAIDVFGGEIGLAGLNINDRPRVARYLEPIVANLYEQVCNSGIEYDAIASIPTGGDAWAHHFIQRAVNSNVRKLKRYRLIKDSKNCFSIIDGQRLKPDSRILVIDDTLYTGAASLEAVEVLEEAGYRVVGLLFPAAIGDGGIQFWNNRNMPVFTTFNSKFIREQRRSA